MDISSPQTLQLLQAKLRKGENSRDKKPRSAHTVHGYMTTVLAALNWAYTMGWLHEPPRVNKNKRPKKKMKGRPITDKEFQAMIDVTATVVGKKHADSWTHVLFGLWTSGLRLKELMLVSWDLPGTIRPIWCEDKFPVLEIPAESQKNDADQTIPLLSWFEDLLKKTPLERRQGWVFHPAPLRNYEDKRLQDRPNPDWVGKIISRIGRKANVLVVPGNDKIGRREKFASAHDLRRSCGQRLQNSGVSPLLISLVLRHESWETTKQYYVTGDLQNDARALREALNGKGAERTPTSNEADKNS